VAKVSGVEVKFRYCPPGKFQMGSPRTEEGREVGEGQHEVELTRGFWLGETPVTQGQWEAVMGSNPSKFKGADRPVEMVSWDDCQVFLSRANGGSPWLNVRLPTEAEWEYGCRAGSTGARYGDVESIAWFDDNSGGETHAVRGKSANAWGVYDMLGNVAEWCADWKGAYPSGRVVDPTGPATGAMRVYRGGSWYHVARHARAAYRNACAPVQRVLNLGFRLARGQ
jgi:formylglycine-generating enzyme required for sulfatase activity